MMLFFAGSGGDSIDGGSGIDTINGGDGDDRLDGGLGLDKLRGGLGNDIYTVNVQGEADETGGGGIDLVRSTGSYSLSANLENLTLLGNLAANALGNELDNRLIGNAGLNTIRGGTGRDMMTGNGGADQFVFGILTDSGITGATRDVITDFDAGTNISSVDRIAVTAIDADETLAGNQNFIFGGPFTAGHIRAVQSGANAVLQFNTDADAAAETTILLQNVLVANLNAGDFAL